MLPSYLQSLQLVDSNYPRGATQPGSWDQRCTCIAIRLRERELNPPSRSLWDSCVHQLIFPTILFFVARTRIELVFAGWKPVILTDRWTGHLFCSLNRIRTYDLTINSRLLYRWAMSKYLRMRSPLCCKKYYPIYYQFLSQGNNTWWGLLDSNQLSPELCAPAFSPSKLSPNIRFYPRLLNVCN